VLGRISSVTQTFYSSLNTFQAPGTPRVRNFLYHEYGFFAQDDWRIKPNFTLNFGIRWEFNPVPYEQNGLQGILTPQTGLNTASQAGNLTIQQSSNWYKNDYHNFAPRFGFAWDPWHDGKTAVRGGFGIFYDRNVGAISNSIDGATPGFSQASTLFPNSAGTDVRI
jgi:outer membrane receptor protein involved in Fe transport